ncbi:urease accessory protein UreD [Thalassorhabdomicrobium marinisediminis]|uniref:Urease accessory protein UreD n=1 Tax=Thalassorhabdomicrobium marinisediminis TaxID=2170577 RepID=A0A2T7FTD0_9RHOB|nr:urease accessory protein UreD [Thalassorhabdomicrobium marinisediminis]PVA05430.1 urease accessory protein [Thalassorhabdomicrobium marinisediminis]
MYDFSRHKPPAGPIGAMSARAVLTSALDARGRSLIQTLRSDGPLVLRKSNPKGPEPLTHRSPDVARVALAAGTAGPLGGDDYALDVRVGAGSTLVLQEVSAMLILPGLSGAASRMTIRVEVEDGATFVWLAEPIIAAHRCNHRHEVRVTLAPDARMILREETLLGRHGEPAGDLSSRLRVTRDGTPLYDQQIAFGPASDGWEGAAVLDRHRAVGSVIAVDPDWIDAAPSVQPYAPTAALTPLAGPGVAIGAVAPDSLSLRQLLMRGLNELGPPWAT